jgi:uncharacterized protein YqjF (DUF2071 family)
MRRFLTADWRWLVILDWEVDPAMLEPLVPAGTTLDLWSGRAFVSMVGFRFEDTRVFGIPIPGHRDFDEVNLRFYVRRSLADGTVRRGVTFIRELVPRLAVALVARATFNEPYRALPMCSVAPRVPTNSPGHVEYAWNAGRGWSRLCASAVGIPVVPPADSQPAFVAEHYWGYTRQRDGGTVEYAVHHPRWRSWRVESPRLVGDLTAVYGGEWARVLSTPPVSAQLAEGSGVSVFSPARVAGRPHRQRGTKVSESP